MTTFFGFAIADSMFRGNCMINRRVLTVEEVHAIINNGVRSCLNASHTATIAAMHSRYGFDVEIPPPPAPQVTLSNGDSLVIMGVRGLPRLDATRHEYTEAEIASATFSFSLYTVVE